MLIYNLEENVEEEELTGLSSIWVQKKQDIFVNPLGI